MILTFLHSIEFYVICIVVAAAVIALFMRPAQTGESVQHLLAGRLFASDDAPLSDLQREPLNSEPSIELTVNDDLTVTLVRHGIDGVCSDGAVSLVVNVAGTDISIEERITSGHYRLEPVSNASFTLDFLRPQLYHLRYSAQSGALFAATPLRLRPGIHILRPLTH